MTKPVRQFMTDSEDLVPGLDYPLILRPKQCRQTCKGIGEIKIEYEHGTGCWAVKSQKAQNIHS